MRSGLFLFYIIYGLTPILNKNCALCSRDEERLVAHLLKDYNPLIQPVNNATSEPLLVSVSVQLVYIIKIIEKNQIMHTNVWLTLTWYDFQMKWNPEHYGGIKSMRVASDKVWMPDIVLFNNADGNYEVSFKPHAVISWNGQMLWVPPAIYKSSCIIDVEFFPFDEQMCHMNFGSWTYNENEIKLGFAQHEYMDLLEYKANAIWDLIAVPGCLVKNRTWMEYQVRIRRKALFYTTVLIIPTILMAFLSVVVFYLPTDSGEKITLTTAILLSIVVFLLLVSKILPPTSSTIPLMAKYLLLTFVLNVITILVTVVVINVYHRKPSTHTMPKWVRIAFLNFMPRLLCLPRQRRTLQKLIHRGGKDKVNLVDHKLKLYPDLHHPLCPSVEDNKSHVPATALTHMDSAQGRIRDPTTHTFYPLSNEALQAIDAIEFITDYIKQNEENKMHREDWKYLAMVIDRFLLYIFAGITIGGTLGIIGSAPHLFQEIDQQETIKRIRKLYLQGDT